MCIISNNCYYTKHNTYYTSNDNNINIFRSRKDRQYTHNSPTFFLEKLYQLAKKEARKYTQNYNNFIRRLRMNKMYKFEANGWALMSIATICIYGLVSMIADMIKAVL